MNVQSSPLCAVHSWARSSTGYLKGLADLRPASDPHDAQPPAWPPPSSVSGDAPGACWRATSRRRRQLRRHCRAVASCHPTPPPPMPLMLQLRRPRTSIRIVIHFYPSVAPSPVRCLTPPIVIRQRLYALYFSFIPMRCPDLGEPALRTHTGARVVRYLGSLICVCVCVVLSLPGWGRFLAPQR